MMNSMVALSWLAALFRWCALMPLVLLVRALAILLAPVVVWRSPSDTETPAWAWWIVPIDHAIAGDRADAMWKHWWELRAPYVSRPRWVDWVRVRLDIHSTRHWIPRFAQLLRNGGNGFNYLVAGVEINGLQITTRRRGESALHIAKDSYGVVSAFYFSIAWPGGWKSQIGWKLNYPVALPGESLRCKWQFIPLRK